MNDDSWSSQKCDKTVTRVHETYNKDMSVTKKSEIRQRMYVVVLFAVNVFCTTCQAIIINRLEVPQIVEAGVESLILDCDYSLGDISKSSGLVVKWFFNDRNLVYQWIPPLKPQVIGILKRKIDYKFKITDKPLHAHRAIKVLRPTTDLSGNYTCVVSTFMEEDRKTKHMLVYSPGKSFHFVQEKKYVFLVKLICVAEDLYPRPEMSIVSQRNQPLKQTVTGMSMNSWGLYSVTATAEVHDDDVTDPAEQFMCVLRVPPAQYQENRTTVYYRGLMPTEKVVVEVLNRTQAGYSGSGQSIGISIYLCFYIIISWCYSSC